MAIFKSEKLKKTETPPLLHPPLVEAVFEIRWELIQDPQTGRMKDPSYPMMYGRLFERLKKDFSFIEDLPSTQAHPEATPFIPRHRLRKDRVGYPLVQVGPGIVTVNDAREYSWNSFKSLILRLVESIEELFPAGDFPLNFIKAELRFVNGIRFDMARENPIDFLAQKLHTKIEISPEHFELNGLNERPNALGLNLGFAIPKPVGHLGLSINMGQVEGKPAIIQQTAIQSFGEMVPTDREMFAPWLEEAHEVAENTFQSFCKGSLMDKFCGGA